MRLYQETTSDNGDKATTRGGDQKLTTILSAVTPGSGFGHDQCARVTVELRALPDGRVVCDINTEGARDLMIYENGSRV